MIDAVFLWDVTAYRGLFFVCFSDNHLETVEEKMSALCLSTSRRYNKGETTGIFNMRGMWAFLFGLFVCNAAGAATLLSIGARLCEYGKYYINGACRKMTDSAALSRCSTDSHIVTVDSDTFVFKDVSTSACGVAYDYYTYDKAVFSAFGGTGTLLSIGARLCESGKYWVNGACRYPTDKMAVSACTSGSHLIWADSDTFTFKNLSTDACYATHSPYQHNQDIFMVFGGHGLLQTFGVSMRSLDKMRTTKCSGAPDAYYRFLADDNTSLIYPDGSSCPTDTSEYIVMNNCQNIDTQSTDTENKISILHPDNNMCAMICDAGSGIDINGDCTAYCYTDDVQRKIHVLHDDTHTRIPLWAKKLTTPALHIRFSDNTVCHGNLVPGHTSESSLKVRYEQQTYHTTY